jgi:hypothetical protein
LNVIRVATIATLEVSSRGSQAFQQPSSEPGDRVRPRCSVREGCLPIPLPRIRWPAPLESIALERDSPAETPGSPRKFGRQETKASAARRSESCPHLHRKDEPVHRNTGVELWKLWNSHDQPKAWNQFQGQANSHSTPPGRVGAR